MTSLHVVMSVQRATSTTLAVKAGEDAKENAGEPGSNSDGGCSDTDSVDSMSFEYTSKCFQTSDFHNTMALLYEFC